MLRYTGFISNFILFLNFLLLFLFAFEKYVELPVWLQAIGTFHPLVLHMPIGMIVFFLVLLFTRSQFGKKQFHKIVVYCLLIIALVSVMAALLGFFLSHAGEYGYEALQQHKIGGIVLSVLCYFLLQWVLLMKKKRMVLYGASGLVFIAVIFTGHTGSLLTHGEDYLLKPLLVSASSEKDPDTTPLYDVVVQPVLEKKCFSCHNESKAKGKLVMTSPEKFLQGGKHGKEWVEGNPDSSRLIHYINLPLEHDDHMPPDGKAQLSPVEMALLHAWIVSGASFEKKISEYVTTDTLIVLANEILNTKRQGSSTSYAFTSVSTERIEKLNTPFRTVTPLYQNSPALQADFFIRESFQKKYLNELLDIREQLVQLNLSKMPVTDADLKTIGSFTNLERLNLNYTDINGSGFNDLKSLTKLKSISIVGTSVTKQNLESFLSLKSVEEIFIWKTSITEEDKQELMRAYPEIKFIGSQFTESVTLALSKPQVVNEEIIKAGEMLHFRHPMPGVTIRYTLDGSAPDSTSGIVYSGPITLRETTQVSAIACKSGWFCSTIMEAEIFVEGIKPVNVQLLSPADKQYPGEGALTLYNIRKGFADNFRDPSWLGYRNNAFEAQFEFGAKPPVIQKVVISYGDNLGAYIFPPAEVEVWGGADEANMKLIKSIRTEIPSGYRNNQVRSLPISFEPTSYSYYKLIARPIARLPEWHSGKGDKGWFFVDEVLFY